MQLGTWPISSPILHQEWVEAICAILAPEAGRTIRIGHAIHLVCDPLDANALVARLIQLLCPGAHLGAVEEHGHRILELVISDEIANLDLEIVLQMYHEHVDCLNECLHEFRQSQDRRQGLLVMVSWARFILWSRFYMDSYVFTKIIVLLCLLLCFTVCTLFSVLICSVSMCVYTLSILYMWMITTRFKLEYIYIYIYIISSHIHGDT